VQKPTHEKDQNDLYNFVFLETETDINEILSWLHLQNGVNSFLHTEKYQHTESSDREQRATRSERKNQIYIDLQIKWH